MVIYVISNYLLVAHTITKRGATMKTNYIAEIRGKQNVTIGQLVLRTGISKSTLTRIENSETDPKQSQMIKIARALKTPVCEVFELDYKKYRT